MKKTVLRLTAGIAVALAVIFLYALAHEGGHALMVRSWAAKSPISRSTSCATRPRSATPE